MLFVQHCQPFLLTFYSSWVRKMEKDVLRTINGMCDNIEELIRNNRAKTPDYTQQKIVLDLYMSVINFQNYIQKTIGK